MNSALAVAVACIAGFLTGASPAQAADGLVVWIDASRAPALEAAVRDGFRGKPVTVVPKEVPAIRSELATVTVDQAPDIIWGDNSWTGELAQAGLIAPVPMSDALRKRFAPAVLTGYRFSGATYGVPVQFENVALVTNGSLVPAPVRDFAALEKTALDALGSGVATVGIAVAQGEQGNAYFMNPLYAGLGGYMFGRTADGSLNTADIGINNPTFNANAKRINAWNRAGVIDSSLDVTTAEQAFVSGKAPFWITGPWSTATLGKLTFPYRISPVPAIIPGLATSPYVGSRGFMITKFASEHGLLADALGFVRKFATRPKLQASLAAGNGVAPRSPAVSGASSGRIAAAFANAAKQGVPFPNVPQAAKAWGPIGQAWAKATKGQDSTPARRAFAEAQREVTAALAP